ncbi:hypothetical protein B566_EDAN002438 [Ephemera danica]|nr:hypothetical protein B566_EDAN002438 [Ephemera danica]
MAGDENSYWVLGTDYTNFTIVWSCEPVTPGTTFQSSWVLTRERVPSPEVIALAQQVIDQNQLPPRFEVTNQTNCPDPTFY